MVTTIELGEIVVEVVKKNIKNIHLSVNPPAGAVRIAAPLRTKTETIRVFAISKLGWIKQQQKKLRARNAKRRVNTWTAKAITSGESAICCRLSKKMPRRTSS